ncbi:RNI-like protein [Pleomassaria siparia CBS 279.74]|uniref:RNI-like protein n=1 Tax=Pleomassaria siparia CBS 279.74 TaxID=1314801 RepID=A0A6G1KBQ9_9PLEO|nr:RNI-like protein [Pleomassaria siparia CBS 279.74]
MDDLLPSYESVIAQNPWELVAPYLQSYDLCSAALVCQRWHAIFTPQLWGNPASHFGVQNDTVYVALTRFKRTLLWSRLSARELTHTLHLPPAHAEIYGGPHSDWLRDCLERLPNLQSLIVNGLPFFDHASLLTLRHSSQWWRSTRRNTFPLFRLRLLDASGCTNVTSTGLSEALSHLPDLVSLDLSRTPAAKDEVVFSNLKFLPSLRVLKLKGLGLKDADISVIGSSVRTRLRSLDVSQNKLTDASARLLLEYCVKETNTGMHTPRTSLAPVDHSRPLGEIDIFGTEDLDSHLRKKLTQGFVGSLAIEDARDVGITHLYLSKNAFTVEGISGLLRSKRLQVLDVGTLPITIQSPNRSSYKDATEHLTIPGVEKLTPTLAEHAAEKMVYLRINYAIVTNDAPFDPRQSPRAELDGDLAIYKPSNAHELEVIEPLISELESTDNAIYELPGRILLPSIAVSSGTGFREIFDSDDFPTNTLHHPLENLPPTPTIEVTTDANEVTRGPTHTPEPLSDLLPIYPISPVLDASGGLSTSWTNLEDKFQSSVASSDHERRNTRHRHNSAFFTDDLRARLDLRQSQENRLHPGMLPKVHTLVLTDVPITTEDHEVIDRLIQFIKDCAEEAEIARLRAKHTYMLPPGRCRKVAEQEYASEVFALRRIVLEMAPAEAVTKKISTSWRQYPTKSSTEDADSETFWDAAQHDFSFFDDEECGLPTVEPGRSLPLVAMDGLMVGSGQCALSLKLADPEVTLQSLFDVVSEIGRFRKDRKAAYTAAMQLAADSDTMVEGYWPGDITVVRKLADEIVGSLDYYGNRFEGWLYR